MTTEPTALQPTSQTPLGKGAVIAMYDTHSEAEAAIRKLQSSGFDMTKLSIIGKDYRTEEEVVGYYSLGDRMKLWGTTGAFWGAVWTLLFGSAFFLVPGVGPLLAAGPIVVLIVQTLESAAVVGGFSALGAALFSIGIPKDSIIEYETQIKAGKFVVIAHAGANELEEAKAELESIYHKGVQHHRYQFRDEDSL